MHSSSRDYTKSIRLAPLGDLHYGPDCDLKKLSNHIDKARKSKCFFIGLGDYLDIMRWKDRRVLSSVSDSTKALIDDLVRGELDKLCALLKPTIGEWIGLVTGNHCWVFGDGTSTDQLLAQYLKCEFWGTSALLGLNDKLTEETTVAFVHHGSHQGAQLLGTNLLPLERQTAWSGAHLILSGHTHQSVTATFSRLSFKNGNIGSRDVRLVRTGGWQLGYKIQKNNDPSNGAHSDFVGHFVEERAMRPAPLRAPIITVAGTHIGYED